MSCSCSIDIENRFPLLLLVFQRALQNRYLICPISLQLCQAIPRKKLLQPKECTNLTKDLLKEALDAVFEGKMSQRVASKTFGIPQPTISDYIRHKQGNDNRKPGHKPVFSQKGEEKMVKAASDDVQMGLGLS